MIFKILAVAGLSTLGIHAAIPAGLAFQLSPWLIFVATVCGGLFSVYLAAFFGNKIKAFLFRKKTVKTRIPETGFIHNLWNKYGVVGLGLLGTMTAGATISIAIGLGFKVPLKKLISWCCVGVITRCAIFTTIGYFGLKLV